VYKAKLQTFENGAPVKHQKKLEDLFTGRPGPWSVEGRDRKRRLHLSTIKG